MDRSFFQFAIAKGREDLGQYDKAIEAYDIANSLAYDHWFASAPWDKNAYDAEFDRIIDFFSLEQIRNASANGNNSSKPVLIVGMPRSGTTLVEQVISSHGSVAAGGELEFWHSRAFEPINFEDEKIDEARLQSIGEDYLKILANLGPTAKRVTDKMPQNFVALGVICSAFPNAKIIHVRRNAFDNCLSIYTTAFGHPPVYALRREDIVFAYREYSRMMRHWQAVLAPSQLLEVNYEELISNREAVTRRMIEFIGLPWSDSCMHHEENRRAVNTASAWQVRQPVYASSVDRWLRFQPWMKEFSELSDLMGEDFKLILGAAPVT